MEEDSPKSRDCATICYHLHARRDASAQSHISVAHHISNESFFGIAESEAEEHYY